MYRLKFNVYGLQRANSLQPRAVLLVILTTLPSDLWLVLYLFRNFGDHDLQGIFLGGKASPVRGGVVQPVQAVLNQNSSPLLQKE